MARIELRHCTIRIKDGFSGTAAVDDTDISGSDTTLEIDTVANLSNLLTRVPTGARFSVAGIDTIFTVTGDKANKVFEVVVDADDGNFTLTFNGETTGSLDHEASASTVQSALEGLSGVVSGDVLVTSSVAGTWRIECTGNFANLSTPTLVGNDVDLTGAADIDVTVIRPGATTWELTFTPALDGGDLPSDDDVITFLPQQIEVKIGEGNITYTENDEYIYDLDRGQLDTVREGDEQPMDVNLEFVYEFITTGTGELITPMDAIKRKNGASGWVSSSTDACEPYSVDIEVEHSPPCGGAQKEITLFPDFRSESRDVNFQEASVSIAGRCNASEPIVTREDQ